LILRTSDAARTAIKTETRTFTGGFHFDDTGNMIMKHHPGDVKYVGRPNPEIDQAWMELMKGKSPSHPLLYFN
jgi:hypothetical protein